MSLRFESEPIRLPQDLEDLLYDRSETTLKRHGIPVDFAFNCTAALVRGELPVGFSNEVEFVSYLRARMEMKTKK